MKPQSRLVVTSTAHKIYFAGWKLHILLTNTTFPTCFSWWVIGWFLTSRGSQYRDDKLILNIVACWWAKLIAPFIVLWTINFSCESWISEDELRLTEGNVYCSWSESKWQVSRVKTKGVICIRAIFSSTLKRVRNIVALQVESCCCAYYHLNNFTLKKFIFGELYLRN